MGVTVPPPATAPIVTGWFAIFNLLARQNITVTNLAVVVGTILALSNPVPITNPATAKGVQTAPQAFTLTDAATLAGARPAPDSFTVTDAATSKGVATAADPVVITDTATVLASATAADTAPITDSAQAKGQQAGTSTATMTDAATSKGQQTGGSPFAATDSAAVTGMQQGGDILPIGDAATVIGIVLAPEQMSILNACIVTETIASESGGSVVPVVDSAIVKGMMAAGDTFTVVNAASVFGRPSGAQSLAITDAGTTTGVATANIQLLINTAGIVYARIVGAQTVAMTNAPAAFYGTPGAAQVFTITNAATATQAAALAYDAVGVGKNGSAANISHTWSHTAAAGATVFVDVVVYLSATISAITYDSAAMTLVGSTPMTSSGNGTLYRYRRDGVAAGAKTVSITLSASTFINASSTSFTGLTSTSAIVAQTGSTSQNVTCTGGQIILFTWGAVFSAITASAGGTRRYLSSGNGGISIHTATATTTFTMTGPSQQGSLANVLT